MKMSSKILACLAMSVMAMAPHWVLAAIPNRNSQGSSLEMALNLPFENRLAALKARGPAAIEQLGELAFDESQTLNSRWKALTAYARLKGKASLPALERALASKDWFMRNAALTALPRIDRELAEKHASELLNDGALVIRTAAVEVLDKIGSVNARRLLWRQLYAEHNFRASQSLWIRRHIARTLSRQPEKGEESRFARLLRDQDPRLHPWAVQGLEKSMGQTLGDKDRDWEQTRSKWIAATSNL